MPEGSCSAVRLRPAREEDSRSLWEWRNDPDTRAASFRTDPIPQAEHARWFATALGSAEFRIFVVLDGSERPIGYVRFGVEGSEAEISVSIAPEERGKGYGVWAIRASAERLLSEGRVRRIVARVKCRNGASVGAFQRAGFASVGRKRFEGEVEAWELVYPGGAG